MSFFDKIKNKFGAGKLKKEQIENLQAILRAAVFDGEVSEQELARIHTLYFDSGLNADEFQNLKSEAFLTAVEAAIADRRVTEFESNALLKLSERLEITPDVMTRAKQQVGYFEMFSQIESGAPLPVGNPLNIILKKDELAHLCLPAALIEEKVISRQYSGGSRGVSVPIVKGIRFNVGSQRGRYHSISANVPVSQGHFVITNKRLVFSGNRKSVVSDLAKLLDLQVYSDALQFSVTNRQKPTTLQFSRTEEVEACGLIISRLLNEM